MERSIQTLEDLEAEAAHLVATLVPNTSGATLVTLSGELGAGKTAFTQAIARTLGVAETVTSPTFVLEKIYQLGGEASTFKRLIHIDAYRLEKGSDLGALGFDELMQDAGNLILLEWPEKVADAFHKPTMKISFLVEDDDSRIMSYA